MPKVLIVSDSHGLTDMLSVIKERHQVDQLIHCGDSELEVDSSFLSGFEKVKGNCDFNPGFENDQQIEAAGVSFFVTHGHLYQVKRNLQSLSYKAQEVNAQVICFGHTHIAGAEKINGQLFINPGSIRLPRKRVEPTYAILSWDNLDEVMVEFYHAVDGTVIDEMTYHTTL